MIHYHGGPLGKTKEAHEFFTGRHSLVSFAHTQELEIIAEVSLSFIFDNGAFSVWKKGGTLDRKGYYKWVDDWRKHPGFDWALIPDIIEGSEEENDALISEWPYPTQGVPVWHLNESIERLNRLAHEWPRISLGSTTGMTPGSKKFWRRIAVAMDTLCDSKGKPICKLHGLRMLDPSIFIYVPFASSDSANAALNSFMYGNNFGIYQPKKRSQRANVIADRIESCNSASVWNPNGSILIQEEIQLCGQ
tara:strand:- start:490 stop:1233 length:744 start_codon:yes stop_codon:yes gene_type:complete